MAQTNQVENYASIPGMPCPPEVNSMHEAVSSWFLGPKAENERLLRSMFEYALGLHSSARKEYHPEDGVFISSEIQSSDGYKAGVTKMNKEFSYLSQLLQLYSIPFFSPRYCGHMTGDVSMPAVIGHLATTLYNPNNVAFEASPITTLLEIDVGNQLCEMLGYKANKDGKGPTPWGHVTCDGTIANLESIWAARNLKFYALSLREAIAPEAPLKFIADSFHVFVCEDIEKKRPKLLKDLDLWELMNLRLEEVMDIPERLEQEYQITQSYLNEVLHKYLIQTTGKDSLERKWQMKHPAQYLVANTKHYSWPKGAAIAGIGGENMVDVPVDPFARVSIPLLRDALESRLKKKQPVYAVVAVIGTTEEGAVDPIAEIIKLRDEYRIKGMSFVVHADAAWGGYFASMIRRGPVAPGEHRGDRDFVPSISLRPATVTQLDALQHADSITIDPHKSGYIPYPAGGLCYRDGRMRFLLTWTAPYLNQGDAGTTIGIYGVEGSKPGAPVAATWLHHTVVGLNQKGHGGLLGEVCFASGRLSAYWAALSHKHDTFTVVPFNPLVQEPNGDAKVEQEKEFIRTRIIAASNEKLIKDTEAMEEFRALGSDLNINAFACNFRLGDIINDDVEEANEFNHRVIKRFSVSKKGQISGDIPFYLTSTIFETKIYGDCVKNFKRRMGLETESKLDLWVLRNVAMSPFQPEPAFLDTIMGVFKKAVEEVTNEMVARNTISPDTHSFTMQGSDKLHLVYRPQFCKANRRTQLILRANMSEFQDYVTAVHKRPTETYTLVTRDHTTLETILKDKKFFATVYGKGLHLTDTEVTIIDVVKQRPLNSRYRDEDYPQSSTPFYMYGTPEQIHIDHMILQSPNAVISSTQVGLDLVGRKLNEGQLSAGVLAFLHRSEDSLQPLTDDTGAKLFHKSSKYRVTIYDDPREAVAHGPGLATVRRGDEISSGTLTFPGAIYIDAKTLNLREDEAIGVATVAVGASLQVGVEYKAMEVSESAKAGDILPGTYVAVASQHATAGKTLGELFSNVKTEQRTGIVRGPEITYKVGTEASEVTPSSESVTQEPVGIWRPERTLRRNLHDRERDFRVRGFEAAREHMKRMKENPLEHEGFEYSF